MAGRPETLAQLAALLDPCHWLDGCRPDTHINDRLGAGGFFWTCHP
jgi:hypothetical protein